MVRNSLARFVYHEAYIKDGVLRFGFMDHSRHRQGYKKETLEMFVNGFLYYSHDDLNISAICEPKQLLW